MEEHVAALHTATNALQALGRGFDVNFDTRLLYCKGVAGSRVVEIDEEHPRDLLLYDDVVIPNVSRDIRNSQESIGRQSSGVCSFQEMLEYFNHKASISGSFALGSFNSAFSFTGSKRVDAAATKTLSSDGFYIPLAKVQLMKPQLMLQENVKRAVPVYWDPPSLASFIENFGTHVITSITIGGKDVIYVKQHHTSPLSKLEIKNYIQEIGNQRFSDINSHTSSGQTKSKDKGVDPFSFNSQGIYPQPTTATYSTGKEDRSGLGCFEEEMGVGYLRLLPGVLGPGMLEYLQNRGKCSGEGWAGENDHTFVMGGGLVLKGIEWVTGRNGNL